MSNYANTKATIAANVYTNHNNEVTAEMVKTGINAVVDSLIAGGFLYKGVAHPGDAAVSPDANVFYIASEAGTYTNKGGLSVADGEVAILKYNGSWSKEVTGAATAAEVSALGQEVDGTDIILDSALIGGWNIAATSYSRTSDPTRVALGEFHLNVGDKVILTDYTKCRMYVGWKDYSGTGGSSGAWLVSDFTAPITGTYVVTLEGRPAAALNNPGELTQYVEIRRGISLIDRFDDEISGANLHHSRAFIGGWVFDSTYYAKDTDNTHIGIGPIHLEPGDIVGVTDGTKCGFKVGFHKDSGGNGYVNTLGFTYSVLFAGNYVFSLEGIPAAAISDPNELAKYFYIERVASNEQVTINAESIAQGARNLQKLGSDAGVYFPIFEMGDIWYRPSEHRYVGSTTRVRTKQGQTLHLYVGDVVGLTSYSGYRYYLGWIANGIYHNNGWRNSDYTISEEGDYSFVIRKDPESAPSSINELSALFFVKSAHSNLTLKTYLDESIANLRNEFDNKGAVAFIIPYQSRPNINVSARTLTIFRGSTIIYNKTYYSVPDDTDVSINLAGFASGNKKVIFDKSDNSFSCVPYTRTLTDTQAVLCLIRTDYVINDGLFTQVQDVVCACQITVNGLPLDQYLSVTQSKLYGRGSIALDGIFKQVQYGMSGISQTLFDTETYSVGIQSFGIYDDKTAVFIINAELRSDPDSQRIGAVIVDINSHTKLGEFEILTSMANPHGNNMNFGAKFSEDDVLPLLYVSLTYTPYECIVLRIANDYSSYSVIQTISYSGASHFAQKRTIDWMVDGAYIWAYGSWWTTDVQYVEYVKFELPQLGSANVALLDTDVIDSFIVQDLRIAQGSIISGGKIYGGFGTSANNEFLKVVDIESREIVAIVNLPFEPEGISTYHGKLAFCSPGMFWFRTIEDIN